MKYSQSIHDLSHIPERDKTYTTRKQGNTTQISGGGCDCHITNDTNPPQDLQLCNCYMTDFMKNTTKLSEYLNTASSARKLQLDKTLNRYHKMHKSLPVSPVSEERSFCDFVERDEESFSSDSLEETNPPPRRCVSNHEISRKNESFYLTSAQDSICNSLESVLSNNSECKSAPLEVLFDSQRQTHYSEMTNNYYETYGGSLPKNYENIYMNNTQIKHSQSLHFTPKVLKTTQTQTDFTYETPEEIVARKTKASADFQQKLLKFENAIAQNAKKPQKGVAFFVTTQQKENMMYIPSLECKNRQYKSKFCNILNNKPDLCEKAPNKNFALTNVNFEKNTNCNQQTSSLDRHLFLSAEKVCHKPPKAVRRHSSKTRKTKQYEYIKKEDFYKKLNVNTIELSYKEKNYEKDLEVGNNANVFNELYDSLDKDMLATKMDYDSLEVTTKPETSDLNMYDSLEVDSKKIWSKKCDYDEIQMAPENVKVLNEIQQKVQKIHELVDVFKRNICCGKVQKLSNMYERLSNTPNNLPCRKRNLSLPSFVRLNSNEKLEG